MIKNIALKNFLMNTVFKAVSFANTLTKKRQNQILLYSNEGFRDNIYYLYNHLIEQHYNDTYTIYCSVDDYARYVGHAPENVHFISNTRGVLKYLTSAHIYYCFGRLPIVPTKDQVAIQMWHGTSFKGFDASTRKTNSLRKQYYTYVFASSEYFKPIVEKKFACRPENVFICGHPRTDTLYRTDVSYDLGEFHKNIIWLPTFRKSTAMGYSDVDTDQLIPFFEVAELEELDVFLRSKNVQIIIKLHPMQDVNESLTEDFTNLIFLTDQEFRKRGYDLYVLLRQMDALITDYSSVFYDFLLLDRPIGFTESDEEQYKQNRGFAVENPDEFKPGMRIGSKDGLYHFIEDVAEEKDEFKNKRTEINALSNEYQDGRNCERALKASGIL